MEEAILMGSLFEELEAREATARVRVDELEEQLAEVTGQLEEARENLDRLRIARETVSEVMAEISADASAAVDVEPEAVGADETEESSAYAGAERQMVGVLAVPHWRPGMDTSALPRIYRDIVEVVRDAPGPVRAKQVVPRIGLPAEVGKIEGTRGKLKRLVARGWLAEGDPGLFTPAHHGAEMGSNSS
ncbi:hypothetical protein OG840_18740 [Streptomyces sp. NBC_01764]|uniref:hypothetical protein n=1 Tax=Streptomyces sp. NBC_01764 TaxID=2975935 RepID=UPI002256A22D|nr:hypothetical protein [Streptomyces sp. NBC_01764]MCX4403761.1 hypothetical protein [Streptomyces sp. NBC_01764]